MMIRSVLQHPTKKCWAYVEWNDQRSHVLGGKEFATQEEAEEFSKGFDAFSYEWVEPTELAKRTLLADKAMHEKELERINAELDSLQS